MADAELKRALVQSFEWVADRADPSEWWRSPSLFAEITARLLISTTRRRQRLWLGLSPAGCCSAGLSHCSSASDSSRYVRTGRLTLTASDCSDAAPHRTTPSVT